MIQVLLKYYLSQTKQTTVHSNFDSCYWKRLASIAIPIRPMLTATAEAPSPPLLSSTVMVSVAVAVLTGDPLSAAVTSRV